MVLHGRGELDSAVGKLLVVQSAGKPRPLSKFKASALALRPLHKTIYGHLKRFGWLLVGPPTREKLKRAGFKEGGGELVSGDYASATDGLSVEVAEVILETLMSSSIFVPENVKLGALRALRPLLLYGEDEVSVSTGQMMGSYLSFPLLCLQNYLAFRWSLRGLGVRKVPVLINGDDILFQLTAHYSKWERSLRGVGLTVETTKTSVEMQWGTINSTLLTWHDGLLEPSWSARFGMFRPAEHPGSLGRSFADFLRGLDEPDLRFRAAREFFKWHLDELRSSGVSLVSLGFRGLLARRLAGIYDLLELPLAEFPRAFDKHGVGYDADFVSRHDLAALSAEELYQSSLELGADKWAKGWREKDVVREAIRYCLDRTACKGRRHDYAFDHRPWGADDRTFAFCLRNSSLPRVRRTGSKAFCQPWPVRGDTLVSWSVLRSLAPMDGEFESLPAYTPVAEVAFR
jgi:hypothetical protein